MKLTRLIIPAFAILLAIPTMALPQGRWNYDRDQDRNYGYSGRIDSRDDAYRAGYNEGYRNGMRRGREDFRDGRRFNNHVRDFRWNTFGFNSRFRNDFRRGFNNGYREGYEQVYRGRRGNRWY